MARWLLIVALAIAGLGAIDGVRQRAGAVGAAPLVLVYGDSLITQSQSMIDFQLGLEQVDAVTASFPGTAICDWTSLIASQAEALHPRLVVIEFSGNNYTPCMAGITTPAAVASKYESDLSYLLWRLHLLGIPLLVATGPVLLEANGQTISRSPDLSLGQLPQGYSQAPDDITPMYESFVSWWQAQGWAVGLIQSGAAVETASGGWTYVLPCLSFETAAMGCSNGQIIVRAPDLHHLCPGDIQMSSPDAGDCSAWSSGAWRFAAAISTAVAYRLGHSTTGALESAQGVSGGIALSGWSWDPMGDQNPDRLLVSIDESPSSLIADQPRSDVATTLPLAGPDHGFSSTLPARPGPHSVCVTALGIYGEDSGHNLLLGCRQVVVPDTAAVGQLESLSVGAGSIETIGWAYDPDAPTSPVTVTVDVDGSPATSAQAQLARPDVPQLGATEGPDHGFDLTLPVTVGSHSVCVSAAKVAAGAGDPVTQLGCQTVSVAASAPSSQAPQPPMNVTVQNVTQASSASAWWSLTASWSPPAGSDVGGAPVDGYRVQVLDLSSGQVVGVQAVSSEETSATFSNTSPVPLRLDDLYEFAVQAHNAEGWSSTLNYSMAAQAITGYLFSGMTLGDGQYLASGCAELFVARGAAVLENTCGGSGRWAHWSPLVDHATMLTNGDLVLSQASGQASWDTAFSGTCAANEGQFAALFAPDATSAYVFFWNAAGTNPTCAFGG